MFKIDAHSERFNFLIHFNLFKSLKAHFTAILVCNCIIQTVIN